MMKQKLKKLLALALSLIMMSSLITPIFPAAQAAGSGLSTLADTGGGDSAVTEGTGKDFYATDGGRPNLYVDFLGDNKKYRPDGGAYSDDLNIPAGYDQSFETNPSADPVNKWKGYIQDDCNIPGTIFWVGVGVDREQVLKLLEDGKGLTSLELGFYYNNRYIEPYTGDDGDFAATIAAANINNGAYPTNTQWHGDYVIRHAETGLPIADTTDSNRPFLPGVTDEVTREPMKDPSIDNIREATLPEESSDANRDNWKMTYISLEMTMEAIEANALKRGGAGDANWPDKFDKEYFETDEDGNPKKEGFPEAATGTDGPQYLLLIPFRLKRYDSGLRLCLRLIRDATHFSIGAGDDGVEPYAAWEKTTTRNPGHDLKLLTRFTGDLNIFTGGKSPLDPTYDAILRIINGGDSRNHAELGIADDPSITPVTVDANNDYITKLQEGTGMQVRIQVQPGYIATVEVYKPDEITGQRYVHQVVIDQEDYRFVMPADNVVVVVRFEKNTDQDPTIFLSELFDGDGTRKEGNNTTIETGQGPITSWDETESHRGLHSAASGIVHPDETPAGPAKIGQIVEVKVNTHADYIAKVHIYNFADQKWVEQGLDVSGKQSDTGSDGLVTLPYGGTVKFEMPDSNMDVEVTYERATPHTAKLEVWHYEDPATGYKTPVSDLNVAQLVYSSYNDQNVRSTAYSGKVYENDKEDPSNHSAVKNDTGFVSWIPQSAATMSDSLGGDSGRTGTRAWRETTNLATGARAIMSQLYAASDLATFAGSLKDINYNTLTVVDTVSGFRRTLQGETYGDNELYYATDTDEIGLANVLWEMRTRILQDPGLSALYVKSVYTDATMTTEAFRYINLTPAQVQAYILEMLQAQEHLRLNELRYRDISNRYQKALKRWKQEKAKGYDDAIPPEPPTAPRAISADTTTGVRTYEGVSYRNTYATGYEQYMDAYEAYLNNLSTTTSFDATPYLKAVPDKVTVSIPDDPTAVARVKAQSWRARTNSEKAEISTRSGRTVWVALEADSGYAERTIEIYNAADVLIESKNVTADTDQTGYRNVYSFTMPDEDCTVRVTYRLRPLLDLDFEITGADRQVDNLTTIDAYTANPGQTTPDHITRSNAGNQSLSRYTGKIENILDGSYINALVKTADGYEVTVTAIDDSTGNSITVTPVAAPNPADGVIYRIHAQNNGPETKKLIKLYVAYKPKEIKLNTATILPETYPGDAIDPRNTARWDTINGSNFKQNVAEGTSLTGVVQVAPGYYIHSITATGASGTYTYTVDGNGYNNGLGTYAKDGTSVKIPIQVNTTMPNEDLLVTVTFRRGLPPVEPGTRLTLIVKDDENTGATPANNWAKATVLPKNPSDLPQTLGPVGLATGNGLTAYDYVETGREVEVEFSAATGYYVSAINVGPDQLGVEVTWHEGNKIRFVMPPASAGVTVEFKKGTAPSYFLWAFRTENGKALTASWPDPSDPGKTILNPNSITGVSSDTIATFLPTTGTYTPTNATNPQRIPDPADSKGIGAAVAGEKVTVTFKAAKDWYVQSVVVASGQSAWTLPFVTTSTNNDVVITSGNNDGSDETTFSATFTMPSGDVEFVVNYRNLPMPINPEYLVNLIVRDRDNVNDPATGSVVVDNWVRGSYTGVTSGITTPDEADRSKLGAYYPSQLGVLYPQGGDTVNLEYQLQPGFIIDYIAITPAGVPLRRIYPVYEATTTDAGGVVHGKATFTMPSEDVTVVASIVKSDAPRKYTANLILRPPTGVDVNTVGQGTFASPTGGSLTNYPDQAVFSLLTEPGTPIDLDLFAKDGYYIRIITIDPDTGATATLSGSFGRQNGHFIMPPADVNVNVWFEKKWPDEVDYALTLEVIDPSFTADNYAAFRSAGGRDFTAPDSDAVVGNNSKTIKYAAKDKEEVVVDIHSASGFHTGRNSIRVTDSSGRTLDWRFVPGKDGGQAIAFTMPPMSTKVTVTFYRNDDPNEPDPPKADYEAVLHLDWTDTTGGTAVLSNGTATVNQNGRKLENLRAGQTLSLDVTPVTDQVVAAAYAVSRTTGEQLMLPITLVAEGGSDAFAMPEDNVDVYVTFKATKENHDANDRVMRLVVAGPENSGSATMTQDTDATNTTTVSAPGGDFLWVRDSETVTVTLAPAAGYYIAALTVTKGDNTDLSYDWISMVPDGTGGWKRNDDQQITLTVPPEGGTVYVRYEKIPEPTPDDPDGPTYTAQIVVNDAAYSSPQNIPSRNDAWFTEYPAAAIEKRWREAKPGDWIDLSLAVHEGYKIEFIKVVPQQYGITCGLPLGPMESQSTGFIMPADNVTIYVKFITDNQTRYNATLVVNGAYNAPVNPDDPVNEAQISSAYSGTEGPIHAGESPVFVQALEARETVTVDYTWDAQSSVESVTVKDASGADVPFTQVTPGKITLPMVDKNIFITVTYRKGADPVGYPVVLHVIDNSGDESIRPIDDIWAKLDYEPKAAYNDPAAGTEQHTPQTEPWAKSDTYPWGHTADAIQVPAGKLVDLTACTGADGSGVYIESAYVLYEAGGQMISLRDDMTPTTSAPGLNGTSDGAASNVKFAVHPGRNDVYVTFTKEKPKDNEFAAVLMLKGPAGDTTSRATICVGNNYQTATRRDIVSTNVGHGYVLTEEGETVTVSVTCPGYVIERVLITPLGDPNNPIMTWTDNTGSFTMPRQNVAVTVFLKEGTERVHTVTLHYLQQGSPDSVRDVDNAGNGNRANVYWTPDGAAVKQSIVGYGSDDWNDVNGNACNVLEKVAENAEITVTATLDSERDYTILAAYVLRGATLVPLTPSMEGAKETLSTTTNYDVVDATATFTMPGEDVHVYIVVTDTPPIDPDWRTAVLLTTDKRGALENAGENYATIRDDNVPPVSSRATTGTATAPAMGHTFITVWKDQKVRVAVDGEHRPDYQFDRPATISHSVVGVDTTLDSLTGLTEELTSPYVYRYTVGEYNSAVHVHFVGSQAEKINLNVAIDDWDNPGNGTVKNTVTTTPDGMTPLDLTSTTSAGAYQVIPDVEESKTVTVNVTPDDGYHAVITVKDKDGTVISFADGTDLVTLTAAGTAQFTMPGVDTTVTVRFYQPHTARLMRVDLNLTDPTSQAQMVEDLRGNKVLVHQVNLWDDLEDLPRGTVLTANMTELPPSGRLAAVLRTAGLHETTTVTTGGSTTFLSSTTEDGVDYYRDTMGRDDETITFVVVGKDSNHYVAAVKTVNQPDTAADPTIAADQDLGKGKIWAVAAENGTVTTNVPVPNGYKVEITAKGEDGTVISFDDSSNLIKLTGDGNARFTMPGQNVLVTVRYIKTVFTLTVEVEGDVYAQAAYATLPDTTNLYDTQSAQVAKDAQVDVTATPNSDARLIAAYYRTAGGAVTTLTPPLGVGVAYTGSGFEMPDGDTVLHLVFGPYQEPTPDDPDPDENYYIAMVNTVGGDDLPNNRVLSIQNMTRTKPADKLPESSPDWAAGLKGDQMTVAFTTEPGWTATVTAKTQTTPERNVTVVQQGMTGDCNATIFMPGGANVIITIEYKQESPPTENTLPITLRLVDHDAQSGNKAVGTSDSAGLTGLSVAGSSAHGVDDVTLTNPGDLKSPIQVVKEATRLGERITVVADWQTGYQIIKITVSVPIKDENGAPTGNYMETEVLPVSRYGTKAAARLYVPSEDAIVTVYYSNIFTATLNIVGATTDDSTAMTDDRGANTVTSTGLPSITNTGERLLQLAGVETIETTAIPNAPQRYLVGVVYESELTGAQPTTPAVPSANHVYTFEMPRADTDVYVYYEDEPEDDKDKYYIAKVAIDSDSQGYGLTDGMGGRNQVTIRNDTDPTAGGGKYWTGAKAEDEVTITVNLIPGYQAIVTSAKMDKEEKRPTPETSFDYYVTRTRFVVSGKTTSFQMPAETDATVTVKYIRGYDLTLEMRDVTDRVNQAKLTADGNPLQGDSDGSQNVTYAGNVQTLTGLTAGSGTDAAPQGTWVNTALTLGEPSEHTTTRVTRYTPFTGTTLLPELTTGSHTYADYPLPAENTVESVLFWDDTREDKLLAKVEVKGESDINGNTATPIIDTNDPDTLSTVTGTVWTTTKGGQTIDLTITVAAGYVAKIQVRRDNYDYWTNLGDASQWKYLTAADYDFKVDGGTLPEVEGKISVDFGTAGTGPLGASISTEHHFTFTMPTDRAAGTNGADDKGDEESDVTVIVEFVYVSDMPAPYDPDHTVTGKGMPADTVAKLKEGFIYAENRGDYALVDIPTLEQDGVLSNTDFYNGAVKFQFYLYDEATGVYTEMILGRDVETVIDDEATLRNPTDPYNYYETHHDNGAGGHYTGSIFRLQPVANAAGDYTAAGQTLWEMLNNKGSLNETSRTTRLYVTASANGKESAYTEVWIRPAYTLALRVISWGPGHGITANLHALLKEEDLPAGETLDPTNFDHYSAEPTFTSETKPLVGQSDKWRQVVRVRSSELLGDYMTEGQTHDAATYALTVEKAANITYRRVNIVLMADESTEECFYQEMDGDVVKRTFRIQDEITLIAGDVDGDGLTKWQDYELIRRYVDWKELWDNSTKEKPADYDSNDMSKLAWDVSVYNPESMAYRCDLNSDGVLSIADLNVLTTYDNYNKSVADYNWEEDTLAGGQPNGMKRTYYYTGPVELFSLRPVEEEWEDAPVPYDPVGDAQVVPAELRGERTETPTRPANRGETPETPADLGNVAVLDPGELVVPDLPIVIEEAIENPAELPPPSYRHKEEREEPPEP